MDAAGIEPVTSRWKTSTCATKPGGLVDILRASFLHLRELATSEFWLNLYHSRRPKQTFVKYAASVVYEPGATTPSFFLQQGPQKVLSLSPIVKCDQQTNKKMMSPIMASISGKLSNKVPIIIFQMLLAGRQTHNSRAFFYTFGWVFMGLIMGSQNIYYGFGLWQ